ncbi:hypothetical protein NMY22_g7996 [Coprinellus aureogranulatus]|nr:hypothetical protein NMY22_g7996 [Coprinellus aureogranulatus]
MAPTNRAPEDVSALTPVKWRELYLISLARLVCACREFAERLADKPRTQPMTYLHKRAFLDALVEELGWTETFYQIATAHNATALIHSPQTLRAIANIITHDHLSVDRMSYRTAVEQAEKQAFGKFHFEAKVWWKSVPPTGCGISTVADMLSALEHDYRVMKPLIDHDKRNAEANGKWKSVYNWDVEAADEDLVHRVRYELGCGRFLAELSLVGAEQMMADVADKREKMVKEVQEAGSRVVNKEQYALLRAIHRGEMDKELDDAFAAMRK